MTSRLDLRVFIKIANVRRAGGCTQISQTAHHTLNWVLRARQAMTHQCRGETLRAEPACVKAPVHIVFLLLICAAGLGRAEAQTTAEIAKHLPSNASLVLHSKDIGATCSEFQQTRLGSVLAGEGFSPLIERLRVEHRGGPLNLQPIFGFDWRDLQAVHQPAVVIFFPLQDGSAARACVFGGTESSDSQAPLVVAASYFNSRGFKSTRSQRGEISLTIFTPPASRQGDVPRVVLSGPGFYGVADSLAAAEIIAAVTPNQSLAETPLWHQTTTQVMNSGRPGDVQLFVRPFDLWEQLRHSSPPADDPDAVYPEAPDSLASSRQTGFDAIQAVIGTISFPVSADCDWQIMAHVVAKQPFERAMRLLELGKGQQPEIPAFVRSDVTSVNFWRWDFPLAMQGFGSMFDEANEPGPDGVGLFEDMLDGLRDDPEGVRVDLRREVFANLGPEIWGITDRAGPQTESQPHGDRALYRTTVREQAQVADALKRFYAGDERVKYERVGEYDIWTVPQGASLFVEGESDSVISVRALAIGVGELLFSTDPDQLHQALSGSTDKPLKDDPAWQELWNKGRGAEAGLWGLAKLDETMAPDYAAAIKPEIDEKASAMTSLWRAVLFGSIAKDTKPPVDAAPKFELVRKGLSRTAIQIIPAAEGLDLTIIGQRSKESP
jgi:hypothetical protein